MAESAISHTLLFVNTLGNCFKVNFQAFCMFSCRKVGIMAIFEPEDSQKCKHFSREQPEIQYSCSKLIGFWKS